MLFSLIGNVERIAAVVRRGSPESVTVRKNLLRRIVGATQRVCRPRFGRLLRLLRPPGGRFSSECLSIPDAVFEVKRALARAIEGLLR